MTRPIAALAALLPRRADYAELPRSWGRDLLAGVTVGVVALPLALAFGISSGAGAAAGLTTAVIAGAVAAIFGGSHVQVSGPTGAMAVVLAPTVAVYGPASLALVTVMAGLIVLTAGATGLGRAVTFIPWPVIEGFTLGIAAIIFLQQIPAAVGQPAPAGKPPLVGAVTVLAHVPGTTWWPPVLIAAFVVVLMVVLPRLHRAIPESLAAIVAATALVGLTGLSVGRIGALPAHLPAPLWPQADLAALRTLGGAAVAVAALAAIESLLSARVAATMSPTGRCFDLIEAVEIGILVAAFFALRVVARRSSVTREDLPGTPQPGDERIALLRLDGAMFFGAAERIWSTIADDRHPDVDVVIIRMSQLGMLDATGAHTLAQIAEDLEARGVTVIIKGVQPEHLRLLANVGVIDSLRHENHLVEGLDEAIAHARTHVRPPGAAAPGPVPR
ncbi:MAG: SulP family inorganic anion transporter [Mycolicibacterium insubricum]|nr:SulP family inorganic anion transporter [Mycobacterium sp.]